jgi:replicative DNA helicase
MKNQRKIPSAPEIEEAVLGAILLDKEALHTAMPLLTIDSFCAEKNRFIFSALKSICDKKEDPDILTIVQELIGVGALENAGGAHYVSSLTSRVASSANVEFHSRILIEMQIKRLIIKSDSEIVEDAFDNNLDSFELISKRESVSKKIDLITNLGIKIKDFVKQVGDSVVKIIEENQRRINGLIVGVPQGIYSVYSRIGGWVDGDLIILAARPSVGKTAIALTFARSAAEYFLHEKNGKEVLFISKEMKSDQLIKRMIGSDLQKDLRTTLNQLDLNAIGGISERIKKLPIYIEDGDFISVKTISAIARKKKREGKLGMIVVDYLGLLDSDDFKSKNREQEVANISKTLKALSRELEVPVILLSQLNRESEKRADKVPQLSDLRESGAIEQDADIVMFLHRPYFAGLKQHEDGTSTWGIAELIVAKNRNGATFTGADSIILNHDNLISKFYDPQPNL